MDATVSLDLQCVLYIEAVEGDGVFADRRGEGILEQTDLVFVEIDIGKHVLHHHIQHIARLEQVVDTRRLLTLDIGLLRLWVLAIDDLRHRLVDTDGQYHLLVILADFHLIQQPRGAGEWFLLQFLRRQVVGGQRQLFILVVFVEVVVGKVGLLLGSDDLLHQLYGGVVLTTVLTFLRTDRHLFQLLVVCLQRDVHLGAGLVVDGDFHVLIAYGTEGELPSQMLGNGVVAFNIGNHGKVVPLIDHAGIGYLLAGFSIGDTSC